MKKTRHVFLCFFLILSLVPCAVAADVPDAIRFENLNGQQRAVKTYTLSPDADPDALMDEPFDYEGYHYTWAYTTKDEHHYQAAKEMVETVTVQTDKKDLSDILAELSPTIQYDDGTYTGELALNHTTLTTEAAGYATKYSTVTETKVIGPLDRNDMSYVPATTIKNGKTLSLANVEWQVLGTDLVGDTLVPSSYQAVATYSANASYSVATGYVTTAEYIGTVSSSGVDTITYTAVYTGIPLASLSAESTEDNGFPAFSPRGITALLLLCAFLLALGVGVLLLRLRKNVCIYVPSEHPGDYKLTAKFQVNPSHPAVDISGLDPYPERIVAIEIKRPLAKKLLGQEFIIHHRTGSHTYTVLPGQAGVWHEFDLTDETEEAA